MNYGGTQACKGKDLEQKGGLKYPGQIFSFLQKRFQGIEKKIFLTDLPGLVLDSAVIFCGNKK